MHAISRRKFFGFGLGAAAAAGVAPLGLTPPAQAASTDPVTQRENASAFFGSIDKALDFQNTMMDAYATGNTVRLTQSYADQSGLESTSFTYDNAVSIHAYLLDRSRDSLARAEVLGQGLIYAQETNFPFNDGRFAQAYFVNHPHPAAPSSLPRPFLSFSTLARSATSPGRAWRWRSSIARTRNSSYLTAALNVANWIVSNTFNTLGPGGYSFGTNINQFNQSVPSTNGKSTEHNIDTYAFFTMLDELTHHGAANNGTSWKTLAAHALSFVTAMYNATDGYFYTGTLGDQITISPSPIPEDCQSWSYLALLNNRFKHTIDWALSPRMAAAAAANLQTTDTAASLNSKLTGKRILHRHGLRHRQPRPDYPRAPIPMPSGSEGTSHTIAALIARLHCRRR